MTLSIKKMLDEQDERNAENQPNVEPQCRFYSYSFGRCQRGVDHEQSENPENRDHVSAGPDVPAESWRKY